MILRLYFFHSGSLALTSPQQGGDCLFFQGFLCMGAKQMAF